MKIPFLVNGRVYVYPYGNDGRYEQNMNIVMAETSDEAEEIFRNHYESKTYEYAIYYSVESVTVSETLD